MDKAEVVKFVRSVSIMSIAVNYKTPISSIVLFAVDDNLNFFFATRRDTAKAKALSLSSEISMSIWEFDKSLVQGTGRALELSGQEASDALDMIVNATENVKEFWPPILQIEGDDYVVYKIVPVWLRILDISKDTIHVKEQMFQEIEL